MAILCQQTARNIGREFLISWHRLRGINSKGSKKAV